MTDRFFLAVGTVNRPTPYFGSARGEGIVVFEFDEAELSARRVASEPSVDNPTFLSVDAVSGTVYANSEVFGWYEGLVSAYRFDPKAGVLVYLNKQPTLGGIAAYNGVTRDRKRLLVANYAMGEGGPDRSVAVFGIRADGGLQPADASIRIEGTLGPVGERQERSHPHIVTETPQGGSFLVADLGFDLVLLYGMAADGSLSEQARVALPAGSGPRHIAQHPNGRFVYVTNELASTVSLIERDGERLALRQTLGTLPEPVASHSADIHLSPDGRFVYASNRGHDSIACFAVDPASGQLRPVGFTPSGGTSPRNFALTPSGDHLLVANQDSDAIAILHRDGESGMLSDTGKRIDVGTPTCVKPFVLNG